jgi:hypothetical protein
MKGNSQVGHDHDTVSERSRIGGNLKVNTILETQLQALHHYSLSGILCQADPRRRRS